MRSLAQIKSDLNSTLRKSVEDRLEKSIIESIQNEQSELLFRFVYFEKEIVLSELNQAGYDFNLTNNLIIIFLGGANE